MAGLSFEAKLGFLIQPTTLDLLQKICLDPRDDLAISSLASMKPLPSPFRIALLEQRKLRLKAVKKNPGAMDMLFTPLGLEQMTHFEISKYKSSRYDLNIRSAVDLCCGLGGDSLFLPDSMKVVGLDRALEVLLAYRFNLRNRKRTYSVLGDVEKSGLRADMALLDPSRRTKGKALRWQEEDLSPGWNVIEGLISQYGNMAIKLGPGIPLPDFLLEHEVEYIGLRDECLEALVWTGQLGRPGWVKAVELPSGAIVEARRDDLADSFERCEAPGAFLFEPVKSVVRAHLFGVLAERHGLWQVDPQIAYLSGSTLVESPLLKPYRLLQELPFDFKVLKEFLRKEQVGRLEIKKRGLALIPEEFRAKVTLSGPNSGTLIFTKVMNKKTVFWAEALKKEAV